MIHLSPHLSALIHSLAIFTVALLLQAAIFKLALYALDIWLDRRYKYHILYTNGRLSRGTIQSRKAAVRHARCFDGKALVCTITHFQLTPPFRSTKTKTIPVEPFGEPPKLTRSWAQEVSFKFLRYKVPFSLRRRSKGL